MLLCKPDRLIPSKFIRKRGAVPSLSKLIQIQQPLLVALTPIVLHDLGRFLALPLIMETRLLQSRMQVLDKIQAIWILIGIGAIMDLQFSSHPMNRILTAIPLLRSGESTLGRLTMPMLRR
jgi:hypothetical protein